MHAIRGTITDPNATPEWRTPGPHAKDKGQNKWQKPRIPADARRTQVVDK